MADERVVLTLDSDGRSSAVRIVAGSQTTIVVPRHRTFRLRVIGMLFETGKAFLLPKALPGMRTLASVYANHEGFRLLAVGHTDRVGSTTNNDSLALDRAAAVAAYLRDDVDGWLSWYDPSVDQTNRWGTTEDIYMLAALPFGGQSYVDRHSSLDGATRAFQTDRGLDVDGIIGPETRRALVTDYMALDGTTLPSSVVLTTHGCGEHFNAVVTGDGVEEPANRRVELFFFGAAIVPPPPTRTSGKGSLEYPAWVDACEDTTDIDIDGVEESPFRGEVHLELRSNSGAVRLAGVDYELHVDELKLEGTADRLARLRHDNLPPGDYDLVVRWGGEKLTTAIGTRPPGSGPVLVRIMGAQADANPFPSA